MPEPAPQPIAPTPAQLALADWVRGHIRRLCFDAIMLGHASAAQAREVESRWRHDPACPAWRGDACALGCDAGGKAE